MKVKEIMATDIKAVTKDMLVKEAANIMCFNKISGLPVVVEGSIVGIFSEKDVL